MARTLMLAAAAMLSATFTAAPLYAATRCSDIPAEFEACMETGQRAYNTSALGSGDFSFMQTCTEQRNRDTAALCHGNLQKSQEADSESSAFRQGQGALKPKLAQDHVRAFEAAGCTLQRDAEGNPVLRAGQGTLSCPNSPGPWASCTREGDEPWVCPADPAEVDALTGGGTAASGTASGPTLVRVAVPAECKATGIVIAEAELHAFASGTYVSLLTADAQGRQSFFRFPLQSAPRDASFTDTLVSKLKGFCRDSMRSTAEEKARPTFERFTEWIFGRIREQLLAEPSTRDKRDLSQGSLSGVR